MSYGVPAAWRQRLKQTRWPVLRQLVQAARLAARLKRLGRTQVAVEQLQARCDAAERMQSHLVRCVGELQEYARRAERLQYQVIAVLEGLRSRIEGLEFSHHALYTQVDLVKSAAEVPQQWCEEFQRWRRENPVPPEPLVSVCVATWNRARLLTERCLPSLLGQTYPHLEVVVVGDGCTDDTAERIAALNDRRVRFINLPQRARYPDDPMRRWMVAGTIPMNHALGACAGDFITHLDDDDEHDPTRLEKLVEFACEEEADFVWHPFWWEQGPSCWRYQPCPALRLGQVTTSSIFYRRWLTRIGWDIDAHLLAEPGDWNRLRKFVYLGVKTARFPEALLRHYRERQQEKKAA
jgi:hypothetical protein